MAVNGQDRMGKFIAILLVIALVVVLALSRIEQANLAEDLRQAKADAAEALIISNGFRDQIQHITSVTITVGEETYVCVDEEGRGNYLCNQVELES